jgi:hypothetical protein
MSARQPMETREDFVAEYERVEKLMAREGMPWLTDHDPEFPMGIGIKHTNNPDKEYARPLKGITFSGIQEMMARPVQVPKGSNLTPWCLASTLKSRKQEEQAAKGHYRFLWGDVDATTKTMAEHSIPIVHKILNGANVEIYSSRSATKDRQKFRILIPVSVYLTPTEWQICQKALGNQMRAHGIEPDEVAYGLQQPMYLPNWGAFYETISMRGWRKLQPLLDWKGPIADVVADLINADQEEAARKQAAIARKATITPSSGSDVIGAFNRANSVSDLLLQAGYENRGDDWKHPNSQTGSYSARVWDGVRVSTVSTSDPLWAEGKSHDAFGVFTILFHGGDVKKAWAAAM